MGGPSVSQEALSGRACRWLACSAASSEDLLRMRGLKAAGQPSHVLDHVWKKFLGSHIPLWSVSL